MITRSMARKITKDGSSDPKSPPSNASQNLAKVVLSSDNGDRGNKFVFSENNRRSGNSHKTFSNQRLFNFGINHDHHRRCNAPPPSLAQFDREQHVIIPPPDDNQPLPIHVTQNFDPSAADGAYFDLDFHRYNPIVPPLFVSKQQNDDHHRRCNTPPPSSLAQFDHEQHNIIPALPPGYATLSSAAVNEYLIDVKKGIFRTPQHYQLWDMEYQQRNAQLAAGFVQTPPQSNLMDFGDFPVGLQTETKAIENLAENDILEGRVFHAQREIPGFNDFEVRVALGEYYCTYDMACFVHDAYGGCGHS
uniref:Uncharacterized protein n=1 Tax=Panagrolaimus sp. ES5 TaxID=591445 RepID=A0AC34G2B1_9BILA